MRALLYEAPWQMPLRELPEPQAAPGEVVVEVAAAGICGSDVHGYTGSTGRRQPPLVMGHEFSGTVTAVGDSVPNVQVGDRVVVYPLVTCGECAECRRGLPNLCARRTGVGMQFAGAYAERVVVPASLLYRLPDNMDFVQGALVEPLAVAMRAANLTPLQLSEPVAVVGVGPIGLLTIMALRMKGAGPLVAIDVSPRRLEKALRLGADLAVNAREEDAVAAVRNYTGGAGVAASVEAVGASATTNLSVHVVRNGGDVTWVGLSALEVTINMQQVVARELTIRGTYGFAAEFGQAIDAIRNGRVDPTSLVERVAALEEGPQIIHDLASGSADWIKVILQPDLRPSA